MDGKKELANKLIVIDVSDNTFDIADSNSSIGVQEQLMLYKTYEYTDKFAYLTDKANYGTLWNYYQNGILSKEELIEALKQ